MCRLVSLSLASNTYAWKPQYGSSTFKVADFARWNVVLTGAQLAALHQQTADVCASAVAVNADDTKFPEDWLFKHRWASIVPI